MSSTRQKLRDLFYHVEFPAYISVLSVTGLELFQRGVEAVGMTPNKGDMANHFNLGIFAGTLGVAVGNCFNGDHSKQNVRYIPMSVATALIIGTATERMPESPYIAAFAAAAVGFALRKNNAFPDVDTKYDDFNP